ncbi:hypothetical protein BKA67DRAFT_544781 [Truncatella angustata]|uniref:Uncharacterized protein n=1 Tax=Truncatella angustata TaxID=152316 RepID=A0A9P8UWZ0_9PEZI|nr:uncharacterized protein BKA67DRAFT_544781 [Truncatella angustata]KAH6659541.1 hypothetical protein BKA67DRAFT_544781 [Truncatella angustata]
MVERKEVTLALAKVARARALEALDRQAAVKILTLARALDRQAVVKILTLARALDRQAVAKILTLARALDRQAVAKILTLAKAPNRPARALTVVRDPAQAMTALMEVVPALAARVARMVAVMEALTVARMVVMEPLPPPSTRPFTLRATNLQVLLMADTVASQQPPTKTPKLLPPRQSTLRWRLNLHMVAIAAATMVSRVRAEKTTTVNKAVKVKVHHLMDTLVLATSG